MSTAPTAGHVVRRLCWRAVGGGHFRRSPGAVVVSTHDTAEEASAERAERERAVWSAINPFRCGESFFELSSLPAPILHDFLHEEGLEPPREASLPAWVAWWDAARPGLTPDEWTRVRTGLDKLRFFESAERPASGQLYVVGSIHWQGFYDNRVAVFEGIHPVQATRSLRNAEAHRRVVELQGHALVTHDDYYPPMYSTRRRSVVRADPFGPPLAEPLPVGQAEAPFAEVHSVDLCADPTAVRSLRRVYLVHRLAWEWDAVRDGSPHGDPVWHRMAADPDRLDGVPVAAFARRKEAEDLAWDLDFAARAQLNPFRFGPPCHLSTVAEIGFRAMLREAGITLDQPDWFDWTYHDGWESPQGAILAHDAWRGWWAANVDNLSDRQRETVWDLLDQLRFHTVVELEVVEE